jgi:protease I
MNSSVVDKKVAILATNGVEQSELESPLQALKAAGALPKIVSLKAGKIQATVHGEKGDKFDVDLTLKEANPEDFGALVLPGGLYNPDTLLQTPRRSTSSAVLCRLGSRPRQFAMVLGS